MATSQFIQPETTPRQPGSHLSAEKVFPVSAPALYHQPKRPVETYAFDQPYVERLAASDTETTSHFVHYFYKILIAKLRAKMNNQAEDVAQETLYRVLVYVKKNGGIDHPERLGAFVRAVSEHVQQESFRQGTRFQQVPENTPEPVEAALDAEKTCITRERKERIRNALGQLRKSDQVLLQKVFLQEQDKDAICAELKIDRNYLRVQVHRALGRFRKVLLPGEQKASAS